VDAKVALDFHIARESNPDNFKSRNYNKFKYFQYGAISVLGGCKDLNKKISVVVSIINLPITIYYYDLLLLSVVCVLLLSVVMFMRVVA